MTRTVVVILLSLATPQALATTYFCAGEAAAAVEHGGPKGIHAGLADATKDKYLLSDTSGSWQFRELGENKSPLSCVSEYHCAVPNGFAAHFLRERDSNVFTYVVSILGTDNKRHIMVVVKGRCSAL